MHQNRAKGLGSLLADSESNVQKKIASFQGVQEIELHKIEPGNTQPRFEFEDHAMAELVESILVHGIIQPITVRELTSGKFSIISGERRFRAAKKAGLKAIPTFLRNVDDQQSLEMALIENIQRENLNPIEIALSFQRMIVECKLKQEDLGKRVGKSRSTVTNILRLLTLPTEIQTGLILGAISIGQAKPLIPIKDKNIQLDIYHKILDEELNARSVEALVKKGSSVDNLSDPFVRFKEDMRIEEKALKNKTKVPLKFSFQDIDKGNISIKFNDAEELKHIIDKLVN